MSEPPLLQGLAELAEREHRMRRAGHEERYDQPVAARVAAGTAVDGLVFESRGAMRGVGDYIVLAASRNDSRLRSGGRLRLSRGDPRRPAALVELIDDRFEGGRYLLRLHVLARDKDGLFEGPEPWVLDEDAFDLLDTELRILGEAEKAGLGAWLDGEEPSLGELAAATPPGLCGDNLAAFRLAVGAGNWAAIQGPPGSGKTHLLARLALEAAGRGARVLITAVSHQAIHNALGECYWLAVKSRSEDQLRRLAAQGFYKLGASKANNAGLPDGVRAARVPPARDGPWIAGATIYAVFGVLSEAAGPPFDLALFDEAGQAPLTLALGARLAAAKTIFIGDDKQLPPVVQSPRAEGEHPLARMSALHLVRERYGAPFMLGETRRLNAGLCGPVSECFYGGRLAPTPEAACRALSFTSPPSGPFAAVLDPARPLVFLDVPHKGRRSICEEEARWAAALVREAARCGVDPGEIGLIAPYRAQCNRIRYLLQEAGSLEAAVVSTVERFQGQERELVLISMTSSDREYIARLGAFLFSPNRLNVAVSRARTKVVVLGSLEALRDAADSADPDVEESRGCRDFLRLLSLAAVVRAAGRPAPVGSWAGGAALIGEAKNSGGLEWDTGVVVEHPDHGVGVVLERACVSVGHHRESALRIRFEDGAVRTVIPRLCAPALRRVTKL